MKDKIYIEMICVRVSLLNRDRNNYSLNYLKKIHTFIWNVFHTRQIVWLQK